VFDYLTTRELKEILKTVFCQHVLKETVNWGSSLEIPRNTQTSDVACSLKFNRLNYGAGTFNKHLPLPIWPGNHRKASLFTTRKVSRNWYKELAALCAISRQPWKQPKRLGLSFYANHTVIHFQIQYLIIGLGCAWITTNKAPNYNFTDHRFWACWCEKFNILPPDGRIITIHIQWW